MFKNLALVLKCYYICHNKGINAHKINNHPTNTFKNEAKWIV